MNDENNIDLLDLDVDDGTSMDSLPEVTPFAAPHPKKPWLLLGVGLLIIILATYIIVHTVGRDTSSTVDVDLDAPTVVVDGGDAVGFDVNPNPAPMPVVTEPGAESVPVVAPVAPAPQPAPVAVVQPKPVVAAPVQNNAGMPTRVVADRAEATFNPDKPVVKTTTPKKTANTATQTKKPAAKPQAASAGSWYVQFGSYSSRALAESAQRQITNAHSSLFQGRQFVILAAVLPNGNTVYRLRIAFKTSADANGFCRNAKSDGLDCYVAK